jgi:hypothetical protein
MSTELNKAIAHAVNYHSLDAKLNMADWKIADLIESEVQKWLDGMTDVQYCERIQEDAKQGRFTSQTNIVEVK